MSTINSFFLFMRLLVISFGFDDRFQKEISEMMEEMRKNGLNGMSSRYASRTTFAPTPANLTLSPVDSSEWFGLDHSVVHAKYPSITLDTSYRMQSFFAPDDPMAAGMEGDPKSLNDLSAGQAEERFYQ